MITRAPSKPLSFNALTRALSPEVRVLAAHVTASETRAALLTFFRRYSQTALTATDLAYRIERELTEVEQALADLVTLRLIERQCICDMTFYRLTEDEERLAQLDELATWQERWLERARRLAQVVGPSLNAA